jgi:hypothetical protein
MDRFHYLGILDSSSSIDRFHYLGILDSSSSIDRFHYLGILDSSSSIDRFVKVYEVRRTDGRRRTPSDGKSSHGLWPGELKRVHSIRK